MAFKFYCQRCGHSEYIGGSSTRQCSECGWNEHMKMDDSQPNATTLLATIEAGINPDKSEGTFAIEALAALEQLRQQIVAMEAERDALQKDIETGRAFMKDCVEPLRELAMEISLRYEPCGYYCDENIGHVDHKLFNRAKYLFGSGTEDYLPLSLDPRPEHRADYLRKGRF